MPPLILLPPAPGAQAAAVAVLEAEGWRIRRGFDLPRRTWDVSGLRLVCTATVASRTDVERALLAATRGAGLVLQTDLEVNQLARLVDDLRRVGKVELCEPSPADRLSATQRRVLEIVGGGGSLEDAAFELGYSRRTVSRLLADARRALGVQTTAEAVIRFARRSAGRA